MTSTDIIIPTIASTIAMINEYALAIADDSASDSTLDEMQFDIDCILFTDDLDDEMRADSAYAPFSIDNSNFELHFSSDAFNSLRAYAIAAFNMRP